MGHREATHIGTQFGTKDLRRQLQPFRRPCRADNPASQLPKTGATSLPDPLLASVIRATMFFYVCDIRGLVRSATPPIPTTTV